jgi:hypothetical protein
MNPNDGSNIVMLLSASTVGYGIWNAAISATSITKWLTRPNPKYHIPHYQQFQPDQNK